MEIHTGPQTPPPPQEHHKVMFQKMTDMAAAPTL